MEAAEFWSVPSGAPFSTAFDVLKADSWCNYHLDALVDAGEIVRLEAGGFLFDAGEYDKEHTYLILAGSARFAVLAQPEQEQEHGLGQEQQEQEHVQGQPLRDESAFESVAARHGELASSSGGSGGAALPPAEAVDEEAADPYAEGTAAAQRQQRLDTAHAEQREVRLLAAGPCLHIVTGMLAPGQFDAPLAPAARTDSNDGDCDGGGAEEGVAAPGTCPPLHNVGLYAESDGCIALRVPRVKLQAMLRSSPRLQLAALRTDRARQASAREALHAQLLAKNRELQEVEDMVAQRLVKLLEM